MCKIFNSSSFVSHNKGIYIWWGDVQMFIFYGQFCFVVFFLRALVVCFSGVQGGVWLQDKWSQWGICRSPWHFNVRTCHHIALNKKKVFPKSINNVLMKSSFTQHTHRHRDRCIRNLVLSAIHLANHQFGFFFFGPSDPRRSVRSFFALKSISVRYFK